jgi:hypothetical protein
VQGSEEAAVIPESGTDGDVADLEESVEVDAAGDAVSSEPDEESPTVEK